MSVVGGRRGRWEFREDSGRGWQVTEFGERGGGQPRKVK